MKTDWRFTGCVARVLQEYAALHKAGEAARASRPQAPTGKRLVRRSTRVGLQVGLHSLADLLGLLFVVSAFAGIFCFAMAFGASAGMVVGGEFARALRWLSGLLLSAGALALVAGLAKQGAVASHQKVAQLHQTLVCDLEDLPALQSLVRASQEPVQAQEAVLLRGSVVGQASEHQEEYLLRATAGGQE